MASRSGQLAVLGLALASLAIIGLILLGGSTGQSPAPASAPTMSPPEAASPAPSASPLVGAVCTPASIPFDADSIDLTGTWAGNDGGVYYVRQLDSIVWWNGMSARDQPPEVLGKEWNNVGRGEIQEDLSIVSEWADVPRGAIGGDGTVTFQIGADADGNLQVTKTNETGSGRGDSLWVPCVLGFG